MKAYILLFRLDILTAAAQPTPEQMKQYMEQWAQWIDGIAGKGQLASGNHLQYSGKVLRPDGSVTDTPYVANKESVAGYILVTAKNMDNALAIARECPILQGANTNSVEVRETANM
jgi:hypothetical protein